MIVIFFVFLMFEYQLLKPQQTALAKFHFTDMWKPNPLTVFHLNAVQLQLAELIRTRGGLDNMNIRNIEFPLFHLLVLIFID